MNSSRSSPMLSLRVSRCRIRDASGARRRSRCAWSPPHRSPGSATAIGSCTRFPRPSGEAPSRRRWRRPWPPAVSKTSTHSLGRTSGQGTTITLAIDSGSRGVVVKANGPMDELFRIPQGAVAPPTTSVREDRVIVRRLRGGKRGEIEINPEHPWRIQVQGPTWNTHLDLRGINLREIQVDSSASKVDCLLPRPRGVVPIHISSGVFRVSLQRIPGTAVSAVLKSGAVQVDLDDFHNRVAIADTRWETPGAGATPDRYELEVSGGAVRVSLDQSAIEGAAPPVAESAMPADGGLMAALGIVLDGVAGRGRT